MTMRRRAPAASVVMNEDEQQEALFTWMEDFWVTLGSPGYSATRRLSDVAFAVPNGVRLAGGKLSRIKMAAALKRRGVKAGVSDIVIPVPVPGRPGMFLELKRDKNSKITADQETWIALMRIAGYEAHIAVGLEEAKRLIRQYVAPVSRMVVRVV